MILTGNWFEAIKYCNSTLYHFHYAEKITRLVRSY